MKFVKTVIDGKEYYTPIDEVSGTAEDAETVEGEVVDSEESADVNYTEKLTEFINEASDNMREFGEKVRVGAIDLGEKLRTGAKDLSKRVKEGTERIFAKDKSSDPTSSEARLLRLLPYMDAEAVHEICEKLLKNDKTLKSLDIAQVLPFFSLADCDRLFLGCIFAGNRSYDATKVIPYVSSECLTKVVDAYLDGNCDDLDVDALYPYLPKEEIKRIFYHIIEEKE